MLELVSIPRSFFELTGEYERANITLWGDRTKVLDHLFDSLQPLNPRVDDVEIITEGRPSEQGIKIRIPSKDTSFFFGLESCRFSRDDPDWQSAEEMFQILQTLISSLSESSGIKIARCRTTIGMHIQPSNGNYLDILKPFLSPSLASLEATGPIGIASVIGWPNRSITVDNSMHLANALFLKLGRTFEGVMEFEEISSRLRADQFEVFKILGVEERL